MSRQRPRIGDRKWEVDWCSEIPLDENGDGILDQAKRHCALFATREQAVSHAQKVYPLDCYGGVLINQVEFRPYSEEDAILYPHVGFWEVIGGQEEYSGEDVEAAV